MLLVSLAPLAYDYPDAIVLQAPRIEMISETPPNLSALTGGLVMGGKRAGPEAAEDRAAVEAQRAVADLRRSFR